ncbi:lysozyme inhibitor LprI family protein [Edaphobacter aggregans]|uniref:lysozyme inhibitor LprI family protein n=1 Tax=Edaphobacter aggregans TaxID=570835 RepID=UPI0012FB7DD2
MQNGFAFFIGLFPSNGWLIEFVEKLKLAQEAWIKFRDADLDSLYYQKDKQQAYGSNYRCVER